MKPSLKTCISPVITVPYHICRLANNISLHSESELKQLPEENYADMF